MSRSAASIVLADKTPPWCSKKSRKRDVSSVRVSVRPNAHVFQVNRMHRVVITGLGWVTPMGHSIDAVWKRLLNGESGIAKTTIFDASTFPTTFSAEVKNYDLHSDVPDTSKHE